MGCAPARSCSCGMEEPEPEQIRLKCVRKGGHFTVPPEHRVRRAGRPGWGIGGLGEVEGGRRGLGVPLSGGWADPGGEGQMHPREGTDPPRAWKERVFRAGAPPLCTLTALRPRVSRPGSGREAVVAEGKARRPVQPAPAAPPTWGRRCEMQKGTTRTYAEGVPFWAGAVTGPRNRDSPECRGTPVSGTSHSSWVLGLFLGKNRWTGRRHASKGVRNPVRGEGRACSIQVLLREFGGHWI